MKPTVLFFLITGIASLSSAEPRQQYSVTGESQNINAFYHDLIECNVATADAEAQAESKCYAEGFDSVTHPEYESCNNRLFGGKKVTIKFYCQ